MFASNQHIALLVTSLFASACSSSATLRLRDGSVIERKILQSDAETVWVEGIAPSELPEAAGRLVVIEVDGGEKVVGTLLPETTSPADQSDTDQWRRVCVQPAGDAARRPVCVGGPSVEVSQMAVKRADVEDVTHPGSTELGIGAGLLAISVGFVVAAIYFHEDTCDSRDRYCMTDRV